MKLKFTLSLFFIVAFVFITNAQVQEDNPHGLKYVGKVASMTVVPSLSSRETLIPAVPLTEEPRDGRYKEPKSPRAKIVPGKGLMTQDDYFYRNPGKLDKAIRTQGIELQFDVANTVSSPSDPALAVGPNHVFIVYNTGFIIYDKEGNALTGELNPNNIFSTNGCCDLTVSYDNAADRWVLTLLGNGIEVAVSEGSDPTTTNWFLYSLPQVNDYNKLSVWGDGYYITDNGPMDVWALDRTAALAGDANASIQGFVVDGISAPATGGGFTSPQVFNVTDGNMPTAGGAPLVYMRDDGFENVTEDEIWIWTVNVDFANPGNSSVSAPEEFATTPFNNVFDGGGFSNLAQPNGGSSIDAIQSTIMNQAQFRKFAAYNSAIFNFVVDVDATAGELAGIRWYEFRQDTDGGPWTMFQEGTYTAPDGRHAWMGSMAMDSQGNIGMGYSSMPGPTTTTNPNNPVGAFYTGRFVSDAVGVMTVAEEEIAIGSGNIGGIRFGDYAKLDIDPDQANINDFWFITETRQRNHVAKFQIASDFDNDTGVVSIDSPVDGILSSSENVTVTIFNFGENQQTAIPLELIVDGTTVATEVFAGPLESSTSAQYTFTTPVDLGTEGQTYTVTAQTNLVTDEDNDNDATTRDITNIFANDIGVTEITSPDSGEGLGTETVTVTIENFGATDQSNFDVNYTVNDGTAVTESVAGPLTAGTTTSYTFVTPADLSTPDQAYTIVASTSLAGDSNTGNNATIKTVVNLTCNSATNDTDMSIGPDANTVTESIISITEDFIVTQAQVGLNLEHTFTGDLDIFLIAPDGTQVELSTDNGGTGENMIGTVFSDNAATSIESGSAPFTGMFQPEGMLSDFDGMSSLGDWTLQITDDAGGDGGTLQDWTLTLCDNLGLGFDDTLATQAELIILDKGNDQFQIQLATTEIADRLELKVINMTGQTLLAYGLDNNGSGYNYDLDMSYAASGVYIVTLGSTNGKAGKSKRLIVR